MIQSLYMRALYKKGEMFAPKYRVLFDARGHRAENVRKALDAVPFCIAAALCILLVPYIVMNEVKTDAEVAEWWTMHVAKNWELVVGTMTSVIPFSVFEFLFVVLIIVALVLFARLVINLCRARFKRILVGALSLGLFAIYVLDLYTMSMAFGYYRAPMPIYQSGSDYTVEQVKEATEYFLADYNAVSARLDRDENGCAVRPYSFDELNKKLAYEFSKLDGDYFFSYTPAGKRIVNSWFLSDVAVAGITFLPTGEANINCEMPTTYSVYSLAHELAHTKGVQREGDANLVAQYVLINAEDEYLRYCGYYTRFSHLASAISLAGDREGYISAIERVDSRVYAEVRYENAYWAAQPDLLTQLGNFFNDIYLTLNGAFNGTGSYGDGNKVDIITPIDPETGKPQTDPETGKPVKIPIYSASQKMFFYLYENARREAA